MAHSFVAATNRPFHVGLLLLLTLSLACSSTDAPRLLEGDPSSLASEAYTDYDAEDFTSDDEISEDADGNRYDRTNLSIAFSADASVGEVNALLQSIDGSIVSMLSGVYILLVKIPDPGDLDALEALAEELRAESIVRRVTRAAMGTPQALPPNYDAATTDLTKIDSNLAILAPAAWNARQALSGPGAKAPLMIVTDTFGDGPPRSAFDVDVVNPADIIVGNPNPTAAGHGYHVLGIISAKHSAAGQTTDDDLVSGMYPGTLEVALGDTRTRNIPTLDNWMVSMLRKATALDRRVVINTSLKTSCAKNIIGGSDTDILCHDELAKRWLEKLRGSQLYLLGGVNPKQELSLAHLTAAGNFSSSGTDTRRADLISGYASASLVTGLVNRLGIPVPNATGTLVVENRVNQPAPGFEAGCEWQSSKIGGHISGIGRNVWSFTSPKGKAGNKTGTSMATPQLAGLVAYMWTIKPVLSSQEILGLIRATSVLSAGEGACVSGLAPVVDAYAAVLALDSAALFTSPSSESPIQAPVRNAILDQDDSGTFDHNDVEAYAAAFLGEGSSERDFSRLDLNGDGFTGGTGTARFNLDIDPVQNYDIVSIASLDIEFDESELTDTEILCYYAFSPLFQGDGDKRDDALAEACESTKIYFSQYDANVGIVGILSMDAGGSNVAPVVASSVLDSSNPRVSSDGQKLTFFARASGSFDSSDIYVVNRDGTGLLNLTLAPNDPDREPDWSPDGSKVAFHRISGASVGIYVVNADGSGLQPVVAGPHGRPYWSPDGQRLLFSRRTGTSPSFVYTLHSINFDGTDEQLIATGQDSIASYRWSPDGAKILFQESGKIFIVDADGGNRNFLADTSGFFYSFSWSPDGSQIAFEADGPGGEADIFIMNADGSNITNITNTPGFNYQPQWSEAGLYFLSFRDGNPEIYKTNLSGTDQRNLTNTALYEDFEF